MNNTATKTKPAPFPADAAEHIDGQYSDDGNLRAYAITDVFASEPENDYGYPVLRVTNSYSHYADVTFTGYGMASANEAGISVDDVITFLEDMIIEVGVDEAVAQLNDMLGRHHGGAARLFTTNHRGDEQRYIAYGTANMARAWGHTSDEDVTQYASAEVEADEWLAYANGDVYVVATERKVITTYTTRDTNGNVIDEGESVGWANIQTVGGYYGEDAATQGITEALSDHAA